MLKGTTVKMLPFLAAWFLSIGHSIVYWYGGVDSQNSVVLSTRMQIAQLTCLLFAKNTTANEFIESHHCKAQSEIRKTKGLACIEFKSLSTLRLDGSLGRGGASEQLAFHGPLSPQSVRIIGFP